MESDDYFSGDEIQLILQKAIASLPKKQKLVFNMKYFEEHHQHHHAKSRFFLYANTIFLCIALSTHETRSLSFSGL